MKKLLLGLGTLSIAILPVAAVVSCGTESATTLEKEAAKFTTTVTKTPTTTTEVAVKSITDAADATAKATALAVFAEVPTVSEGFTTEVKSAAVDTTTKTTVNVKIVITETAGEAGKNTKEVIFSVTGLTAVETPETPTMETEIAKFPATEVSKIVTDNAATAAPKITEETLETYFTTVELATGFSYKFTTATASGDTVDLVLTVTGPVAPTKDVTISLTGFQAAAK